jgi:ribosome-associated toxin RatA of RatAB toxin-antitoxin module
MPQIKAYDEIQLNCLIDDVWKILTDIPSYHKWWPKVVKLKVLKLTNELIGTEFQANPFGGKSFVCRVVSIIPMKEIKLNYFEGIYRGEGIWSIDRKENLILVSYEVDLEIVDKSIAFFSKLVSIPKIHSMIFRRILKGLNAQIKSTRPDL